MASSRTVWRWSRRQRSVPVKPTSNRDYRFRARAVWLLLFLLAFPAALTLDPSPTLRVGKRAVQFLLAQPSFALRASEGEAAEGSDDGVRTSAIATRMLRPCAADAAATTAAAGACSR